MENLDILSVDIENILLNSMMKCGKNIPRMVNLLSDTCRVPSLRIRA